MVPRQVDLDGNAAELQSLASYITGRWVPADTSVGHRLLAAPAAEATNPALEVLAMLGVSIWVAALVVLFVNDLSRATHHVHRRQHGDDRLPPHAHFRSAARR